MSREIYKAREGFSKRINYPKMHQDTHIYIIDKGLRILCAALLFNNAVMKDAKQIL